MSRLMVASSRGSGESGLVLNEHAVFLQTPKTSHVFYRTMNRGDTHPFHQYSGNGSPAEHPRKKEFGEPIPAELSPGEFYPRIWRGHEHPSTREAGLFDVEISTRRSVQSLLSRLEVLFGYVEPAEACAATFGHELRSLLILACTEVESSWKAILRQHGYDRSRYSTNDYFRLKSPLHLDAWELSLSEHPQWGIISPFRSWSDENGKTTTSLPWYHAYNLTKHDREGELKQATLKNVIDSVAAAQIMVLAQFGWPLSVEQLFRIPLAKPVETFELTTAPSWSAAEEYVAPLRGYQDEQVGFAVWTPRRFDFGDENTA